VILDAAEDRFVASQGAGARLRDLRARGSRPQGAAVRRAEVPYRRRETVNLAAEESVEGLVDGNSDVVREARVLEDLPGYARPGTKLGEVVVEGDGQRVGESSPPVARRAVTTRPRCGRGCGIQRPDSGASRLAPAIASKYAAYVSVS
jgi:hypothetical protein